MNIALEKRTEHNEKQDYHYRLDINITNKGTMTFNGGINGENGYLINITGDGSGNLVLNGRVDNAEKLNVADTCRWC